MVRYVMPEFSQKRNGIILCDSCTWNKILFPSLEIRLSIEYDFALSDEKSVIIIQVYTVYLPNFSVQGKSLPMSPRQRKQVGQNGLFSAQFFCAWQEKALLNRLGSSWMKYLPQFLYAFRWNIETSCYEQNRKGSGIYAATCRNFALFKWGEPQADIKY